MLFSSSSGSLCIVLVAAGSSGSRLTLRVVRLMAERSTLNRRALRLRRSLNSEYQPVRVCSKPFPGVNEIVTILVVIEYIARVRFRVQ